MFFRFLSQLASNRQQHPSRVVTTSLRYRSEFPSLRTPLSRSRASLQLSDAALFLGRDQRASTAIRDARHFYLSPAENR